MDSINYRVLGGHACHPCTLYIPLYIFNSPLVIDRAIVWSVARVARHCMYDHYKSLGSESYRPQQYQEWQPKRRPEKATFEALI